MTTGEPTRPSADTLAGGRYELGAPLGAGGMGVVRRARDRTLHRDVAVKLLADNLAADPAARERFLREARAAASITDPHVVTVHDVGDEAGRPYLVMELVDGPSLADVVATRGPLHPDDVLDVAVAALGGLACAHDAGLLHRDVKPGNLLQSPDGTVKVTDFGVAQAADAPALTRTGLVVGTRSYLAPERRRGEPASVRTDLYALGATLAELLTGAPPEDGAPPTLPADVPPGLRRLVAQLLAADPDERSPDAAAALMVLLEDAATDPRPGAAAGPPPPPGGVQDAPGAGSRPGEATAVLAGGTPDDTTAGGDTEVDGGPPGPGSRTPWPAVAAVAVGLLAATVVWQLATGDDDTTDPAVEEPVPGVERVEDDPAGTARNLADWLRDRAGG